MDVRARTKGDAEASHVGVSNGKADNDSSSTNGIKETNGKTALPAQPPAKHSLRWEVVHRMHLPHFLSDNEFIINGHRPELNSAIECVKSLFRMHTETLNIWTHLVGSVATFFATLYFWTHPFDWQQRLTFSGFLLGAIICMAFSTIYHTLMCHSEPVCKFMAKVDYAGIVFLIVASFPPWLHYGFYCDQVLKWIYLTSILVLGVLSMVAVLSDHFGQPGYYKLRASLFMGLGLCGAIPGIHWIYVHGLWESMMYTQWLVLMAGFYLSGGAIYGVRFPERLSPGTFDIWCQSHQILHVCVLGGVVSCYIGISKLAADRAGTANFCDLQQ